MLVTAVRCTCTQLFSLHKAFLLQQTHMQFESKIVQRGEEDNVP